MRKNSKVLLALLLSATMAVTTVTPAFATDVFSDVETFQETEAAADEAAAYETGDTDVFADDVSQDAKESAETEEVFAEDTESAAEEIAEEITEEAAPEDVFSAGEEAGEFASGDAEETFGDSAASEALAAAADVMYQDGTYTPSDFTFTGGTGKVKITCPQIKVEQGKVYATIHFSSSSYSKLTVDGVTYTPTGEGSGATYYIPVVLNQDMTIVGTTTAMSAAHDIEYVIHITADIPTVEAQKLSDGTYTATVTTNAKMFKITDCTLLVKDGYMTAVLTTSGTGYDRLYVGKAADAQNASADALIAYIPVNEGTQYQYWPVPITELDKDIDLASHSKKENKWYDRTINISSESLVKTSEEVQAPDKSAEALKYLYSNYVDGFIFTSDSGILGSGDAYTVQYFTPYKGLKSSFSLNRPSTSLYKSGWFFSDWSVFKTSVAQTPAKKQTYSLADRTEEKQITATLRLYDPATADSGINDGTAPALAEHTFTLTLEAKPASCTVTIQAVDNKTEEVIPGASVQVLDGTGAVVNPWEGTSYTLVPGEKYTLQASAEGYYAKETAGETVYTEDYKAAYDESVSLRLTKAADSQHKVTFSIVNGDGAAVEAAALTVTDKSGSQVEPQEDGSYVLWDGVSYKYTVEAEDFVKISNRSFTVESDQTIEVKLTALKHYQTGVSIVAKDGHQKPVNPRVVSVTYSKNGETLTVEPGADGTYAMVEKIKYTFTYTADNYTEHTQTWTASGTEPKPVQTLTLSTETQKALLAAALEEARALYDEMTEGDSAGQWPEGSKAALLEAINAAQTVLDTPDVTENACQDALRALNNAVLDAQKVQNPEEATITVLAYTEPGQAPVKLVLPVKATDAAEVNGPKTNYNKPTYTQNRVAAVDAAADVHKELYGDAYLEDTKNTNPQYFRCGLSGAGMGAIFQKMSYKNGNMFRVNNQWVGKDSRQAALKDGDVLSLITFTDSKETDEYLYFTENMVQAVQGKEFSLTLMGINSDIEDNKLNNFIPEEGWTVVLENTETKETVSSLAASDAEGKVSFQIGTAGSYTVKSVSKEGKAGVVPYAEISVKKEPVVLTDGTYLMKMINNNKMFNIINNTCTLEVKDGKMTAEISLHGKGYNYMYAGTKEEAEAAGESAWSPYYEKKIKDEEDGSEGPWYTYKLPVSALDEEIIMSIRNIRDQKWFDRPLTFLSEGIQKIAEPQPSPTPTQKPPKAVKAKKLTVSTAKLYMQAKKTDTIGVIVSPSNTTEKVSFKSGNTSVATVDKNGKVTAKKAGTAKITVKVGKLKKTVTVTVGKSAVKVKSLKFTSSKIAVKKGTVQFLKYKVNPTKATTDLKWTTSNKKIVTVDKNGKIKALKTGTARITVSGNGKKAVVTVNVKGACQKISLNKKSLTMKKGGTYKLKAATKPAATTEKAVWKSSNTKVVKVDQNGKVKALKKGTAKITVKCGKKTATCKITVK